MWFLLQSKQDIQKFIDKFGQELYDKFLKNKQRLSAKGQSADILYYVKNYDIEQLEKLLSDIQNKVVKDFSGKTKNNVVKVAENEDYIVYDVLDWQTAMNMGDGTNWCISGRYQTNGEVKPSQAKQYFNEYKDPYTYGVVCYLFCMPKQKSIEKYCIVVRHSSIEVRDSDDNDLGTYIPNQIPSINYKGFEHYQPEYVDASKLNITGATLLSVEEAKQLPDELRVYEDWWWLRSPSTQFDYAAFVDFAGVVEYHKVNYYNTAVRPALKISNLESSNFKIGDVNNVVFVFGGKTFKIISNNLAFCLTDIGQYCFRENWKAPDANVYEKSDVKKYVDDWFNKAKNQVR